jgi:hypothetical protein
MKVVVPPISAALLAVACVSLANVAMKGKMNVHMRIDEAGKISFPVASITSAPGGR